MMRLLLLPLMIILAAAVSRAQTPSVTVPEGADSVVTTVTTTVTTITRTYLGHKDPAPAAAAPIDPTPARTKTPPRSIIYTD
ncbi:MAG: hypothetical protein HFJ91_06655 [Muribaculaceae bacterium]|nr:hypothetical protein [Muribaculaceae bacterium]